MSEHGWLGDVILSMRGDISELKIDVKKLIETSAETKGRDKVVTGIISVCVTLATSLVVAWFKYK